jgi:hypothetical protein
MAEVVQISLEGSFPVYHDQVITVPIFLLTIFSSVVDTLSPGSITESSQDMLDMLVFGDKLMIFNSDLLERRNFPSQTKETRLFLLIHQY